jgi:putative tryptophan/tyrosine transport system permease protein
MLTLESILGSINLGLLWGVMAIGIYITYRILDFADLTAEGSFTLGAAVCAQLITMGVSPITSTLVAIISGTLAGITTGFLHTRLKIPPILAGILTMTGLYSINLRIMGKSNIPMLKVETIMTTFNPFGLSAKNSAIFIGFISCAIVIAVLWWFFNTELGYTVRATGSNENMISALGVNTSGIKILGLMIGNALVAFSGALVAQNNRYADIGMGTGTIVIGLASVIIGEVIFRDKNNFKSLIAVVLGSIIYRLIITLVLSLGFPTTDLRIISAILLAIALSLPMLKNIFMKIIRSK